jgi:DNA-binding beta-propeller fold protein YncE
MHGFGWSLAITGFVAACLALSGCESEDSGGGGGSDTAGSDADASDGDTGASGCTADEDCAAGFGCDVGAGVCRVCQPGATSCDGAAVVTCLPDGSGHGAPTVCDDGDPCTTDPGCEGGVCAPPMGKDCDDGDACTTDYCQGSSGECRHVPSGEPGCCESASDCDDGQSCTTDTCSEQGACVHVGGPCVAAGGEWGVKGSDDGQLKDPRGIAVSGVGEVFVSDTGNGRIQVFSTEGALVRIFGHEGEGKLNQPSGVAFLQDGRLAVADTGNDRVALFTPDGTFAGSLDGKPGEGAVLDGPADVAAAPDGGAVWVANTNADTVVRLRLDDSIDKTLGGTGDSPGKLRIPRGIAVAGGLVYVSDSEVDRVTVYDVETEEHVILFGEEGSEMGQLLFPAGIALLPTGYIAVADPGNGRIQFFLSCTPVCGEGQECGDNGCGGLCGDCAGAGAACEGGQCTGDTLGGDGCIPKGEGETGCGGCGCEACVCAADAFCCETAWDELCVGVCVNDCGATCPFGEPELAPTVSAAKELADFASPTELFLTPGGVLWVVDNVTSTVRWLTVED